MIRNIVFDMGDVLLLYDPLRSCRLHTDCEADARSLCDVIFGTEWPLYMDSGLLGENAYLARVRSRLNTPKLRQQAEIIFRCWHLEGLSPVPGMSELVAELLDEGYALYVLSNAGLRFRAFQHMIPHIERFSGVIVSAEERLMKPDRRIYERLCRKYHLMPDECLFIDDVPRNVAGAEAAGLRAYCFADRDIVRLKAEMKAARRV